MSRSRPDKFRLRFGAARACLVAHSRSGRPRRTMVNVDGGGNDWLGLADALERALAAEPLPVDAQVDIIVDARWVRYEIVPWRAEFSLPKTFEAYARQTLCEIYGSRVLDWEVGYAKRRYGAPVFVAAVDRELTARLIQVVGRPRILRLTPDVSDALQNTVMQIPPIGGWLALEAETRRVVVACQAGTPVAVTVVERHEATLSAALARARLSVDAELPNVPVIVCEPEDEPASADFNRGWKVRRQGADAPPSSMSLRLAQVADA